MKNKKYIVPFMLLSAAVFSLAASLIELRKDAVGQYRDVTSIELSQILEKSELTIIDVRTHDEYAKGHLPGAKNINIYSADFKTTLQSLDKHNTYVVHCKSGSRSKKAIEELKAQGFERVLHLRSGYDDWVSLGYSVEH